MPSYLSALSWPSVHFGRAHALAHSTASSSSLHQKPPSDDFQSLVSSQKPALHAPAQEQPLWQHLKSWLGKLLNITPQRMSLPPRLYKQLKTLEAIALEPSSNQQQEITAKKKALLNILNDIHLHEEEILRALSHALKAEYIDLKEADRDVLHQITVGVWGFLQEQLHPGTSVKKWDGFQEALALFQRTKSPALKEEIMGALVHPKQPMPKKLQQLLQEITAPTSLKQLAQEALAGSNKFYQRLSRGNTMVSPELQF